MTAVGGEQVLAANGLLAAVVDVFDRNRNAAGCI